jgi:Domain of unknown function DUF11/Right handed beta helix region
MKSPLRIVLALLVTLAGVSSYAQSADVAISILATGEQGQPIERIAVGRTVHYLVTWSGDVGTGSSFEIDAPGPITGITQGFLTSCTTGNPVRCTFDHFAGVSSVVLDVPIDRPGPLTATVRVVRQSGLPDSNPANATATSSIQAVAAPSLKLGFDIPTTPLQPGQQGRFSLYVYNQGAAPATNVEIAVKLPAGGTIVFGEAISGVAGCTIANNELLCRTASLEKDFFLRMEVGFVAPDRLTGQDMVIDMNVTSAEEDFDPTDNHVTFNAVMMHQLIVSNVEDQGSGSLRQAIHDVNAFCRTDNKPCAIVFRIPAPVPASGWFTIQPRTPLPQTGGALTVDGGTQTLFTGDTNPDGPEVEINGDLVAEESGLRLNPRCETDVRNLTVNGFPGYGIEIRRQELDFADDAPCFNGNTADPAIIRENYLGTDPRGRIARPNQRGLGIFTPEAYVFVNLISGNRRAGIYVEDGAYHQISGNTIGAGADGSPLGNGAGIFMNMGSVSVDFVGADITHNVIAHNNGMAIARTRRGEILISENSIFDNLQQGIDAGVDGLTPQRADDRDVPNAPVLFGATYDAARNVTIVRGRIDSEAGGDHRNIEVYASLHLSGWAAPQAEHSVVISSILAGHQDFEIVVPGDFRGMWITATYNVTHFLGLARGNPGGPSAETHRQLFPGDTSELSNAVTVQ